MSHLLLQQARVTNYRKQRRPESLSDTHSQQQEDQLVGEARKMHPNPRTATGAGPTQSTVRPIQETSPAAATVNEPPIPATSVPGIMQYINKVEAENEELRRHLMKMNDSGIPHSGVYQRSDEEKQLFLNDVLQQVETVIQAHQHKTSAEIAKYKAEAENAQLALRNLRSSIEQEGMDLALAPSMIAFQRKHKNTDTARNIALSIPEESQELLESISQDVLAKLASVQSSDDVPAVVRTAVKGAFESIILNFTDQIVENFKEAESAQEALRDELNKVKEELHTQISLSENQRVLLVQETEQEVQALRDQVRSFTIASTGDEVGAVVHQKALDEYMAMLIEARHEATRLRQEIEHEKNHSAQVCLKLKSSLQRRNSDFERAVVTRAEEVVQERERIIADLRRQLQEKESAPRNFRAMGVQVGDPCISAPTADNFVPNILHSLQKDPNMTTQQNDLFEREVWRKTQELLQKYGPK